jgi:hypothetical protein
VGIEGIGLLLSRRVEALRVCVRRYCWFVLSACASSPNVSMAHDATSRATTFRSATEVVKTTEITRGKEVAKRRGWLGGPIRAHGSSTERRARMTVADQADGAHIGTSVRSE